MAGILSAIKLKERGITEFAVYEKGDTVGGTWRENTYPGLGCDVPSHLYCYSFAPNPEWSHVYSPGPEIQDYFERVAREYEVLDKIRFGDAVTRCEFKDGRWSIETAKGHRDVVDVIIAATGVLHHPNIPAFEGIDSFEGALFHSARWDHSVPLESSRIGLVGTGSTAIQIVTALAGNVPHLTLFQRTAQWVMPQQNPAYTDEEKEHFRSDRKILTDLHAKLAEQIAGFTNVVGDLQSPALQMIEDMCRANLEDNVADPVLREKLRPNYRAACKRLIIASDFYQAIQRENTELVTEGIERIEPQGIRTTDGRLHELDVIALATGFKADAFMRPMDIVGRGGITLDKVWAQRPNAYLSVSIPDFPNFFMLNGPNGPVGNFSLIEVAEMQFHYIEGLIDRLSSGDVREISATPEAMDAHEAERVEAVKHTIWSSGCRSWYLDDRGIPATWPFSWPRFQEEMAKPKFEAYDLR